VKNALKYSIQLLSLLLILNGTEILLNSLIDIKIKSIDIICLSLSFAVVSLIAIIIFFKGQTKEVKSQPLYTLAATTLKFLIELVIALVWFIAAKKTSLSYILLFFILYLTFSMFSILVILNTLKKKYL
jgi:hypothetical protein